jgi:hypothetical protein
MGRQDIDGFGMRDSGRVGLVGLGSVYGLAESGTHPSTEEYTYRVILSVREPAGRNADDSSCNHVRRVVSVVHRATDGHERRAEQGRKEEPCLPSIASAIVDAHFCSSASAEAGRKLTHWQRRKE